MTRKPALNIPHPSDKRIYVDADGGYVELGGFSHTEDAILSVLAFHKSEGKLSDRWRQALFLRMFEELKVGPLYYPVLDFKVRSWAEHKIMWFWSKSLSRWEQRPGHYDGELIEHDMRHQETSVIFGDMGWSNVPLNQYTEFYVQSPLYHWLRWLHSHKRTPNDPIAKYADAVEQFVAESFPNVYAAWIEHTEGVYLTKTETEELTELLAGKIVSPRLYHKLTGETL